MPLELVENLRNTQISNKANIEAKTFAPWEARTPDLRISLSVLTYKYDALTDCATGAGTAMFALLDICVFR